MGEFTSEQVLAEAYLHERAHDEVPTRMLRAYAALLERQASASPVAWLRNAGNQQDEHHVITTGIRDLWIKAGNAKQVERYTIPLFAHPAAQARAVPDGPAVRTKTTASRMIQMCADAWHAMNAYTDHFDKGSKDKPSVEVSAIDLVNWCQVIAIANRGLRDSVVNENLSTLQYNMLLAKYERAESLLSAAQQPKVQP